MTRRDILRWLFEASRQLTAMGEDTLAMVADDAVAAVYQNESARRLNLYRAISLCDASAHVVAAEENPGARGPWLVGARVHVFLAAMRHEAAVLLEAEAIAS